MSDGLLCLRCPWQRNLADWIRARSVVLDGQLENRAQDRLQSPKRSVQDACFGVARAYSINFYHEAKATPQVPGRADRSACQVVEAPREERWAASLGRRAVSLPQRHRHRAHCALHACHLCPDTPGSADRLRGLLLPSTKSLRERARRILPPELRLE